MRNFHTFPPQIICDEHPVSIELLFYSRVVIGQYKLIPVAHSQIQCICGPQNSKNGSNSINRRNLHTFFGLFLDRFSIKEQFFGGSKIIFLLIPGSENSDVVVSAPTPHIQEMILLPMWIVSSYTMIIMQEWQKVTYQSNLIIHQVPNLIPSLPSVMSQQQVFHSVIMKDRKQHAPKNCSNIAMYMLIKP